MEGIFFRGTTVTLLGLSCLACVRTRLAGAPRELTHERLTAATVALDGEVHRLATCWSGDREYFLGVDLADENQGTFLRLAIDPMDGPRLRLTRGSGASAERLHFDASACRELRAEIEPTGWRVNHVRDFKGELKADCTHANGTHMVAHVAFSHCH